MRRRTGRVPALTETQISAMAAQAQGIASSLGSGTIVPLQTTDSGLQRAAPGRSWNGPVYVANTAIAARLRDHRRAVDPDAEMLTMRPGLASMTHMRFLFGAGQVRSPGRRRHCPPSDCLANPKIQQVNALPSGTSAPNTVITENALQRFHLTTTTAGWLIRTPAAADAAQICAAQSVAAQSG